MALSLIPSFIVNATSINTITDSPYYPASTGGYGSIYGAQYSNLANSYATLPNGKVVVAFASKAGATNGGGSSTILIKIYNTDGTLYGSQSYIESASNYYSNVGVYAVSDTQVLIYGLCNYLNTVEYFKYVVIQFNPASLSVISVVSSGGISLTSSGDRLGYTFLTSMVSYNSKYYFMSSVNEFGAGGYKAFVDLMEYTPHTTLTYTNLYYSNTVATVKNGPIYWFQSTTLSVCYASYSTGSCFNVVYHTVNLNARTSTSIAGLYDSAYAFGYDPNYTSLHAQVIRNTQFIAGGTYTNGTDEYLYFSWVGSYTSFFLTLTHTYYINDRMKFNGSITTAHFQTHMGYVDDLTTIHANYVSSTFIYGYEADKSTAVIYFPQDTSGAYGEITKIVYSAYNWFESSYSWTKKTTNPAADNVPTQLAAYMDYPINYKFLSTWGLGFTDGGASIIVFYGLTAQLVDYDVTVSYLPYDSPSLSTGKTYVFTLTATSNTVGVAGFSFKFLVNGVQQSPAYKLTDSSGKTLYSITFQQSGYYNLTWELYDPTGIRPIHIGDPSSYSSAGSPNLVYTLTQSYLVIVPPPNGGGNNPDDDIPGFVITSLVGWISYMVILTMVIGPVVLLALLHLGPMSLPVGLSVGATIGIVTGYLPIYAIFILLMLIAITGVMVLKGSFSGGGG